MLYKFPWNSVMAFFDNFAILPNFWRKLKWISASLNLQHIYVYVNIYIYHLWQDRCKYREAAQKRSVLVYNCDVKLRLSETSCNSLPACVSSTFAAAARHILVHRAATVSFLWKLWGHQRQACFLSVHYKRWTTWLSNCIWSMSTHYIHSA